jgi:hypothetical protein
MDTVDDGVLLLAFVVDVHSDVRNVTGTATS